MTNPEPQQGLREAILDRIQDAQGGIDDDDVKGSLAKLATKEIMQLFEQTLHDCLPEKRDTGNPYGTTDGAISSSEAYGFNACIDQAQANLKRRIAS